MSVKRLLAAMLCVVCVGMALSGCGKRPAGPEVKPPTEQDPASVSDPAEGQSPASDPIDAEQMKDLEIVTERGTVRFPASWGDSLTTSTEESEERSVVTFSANLDSGVFRIFDIILDGNADDAIGSVTKDGTTYYAHLDVEELEEGTVSADEQDQIYAMQEDVNYLIENLT